jgi:hypothetical protein
MQSSQGEKTMDGNTALLIVFGAFSCVFGFLVFLGTRHDAENHRHR